MKNLKTRTEDISFFAFVVESENPAVGRLFQESIIPLEELGEIVFFNNLKEVGVYNVIRGEIMHRRKSAEIKPKAHKVYLTLEVLKMNNIVRKADKKSFDWVERKVKELIQSVEKKEKLPGEVLVCFLERIQFHVSRMKHREKIKLTDCISKRVRMNYSKRKELV